MKTQGPLLEGIFIKRLTRFSCLVEVEGKRRQAFLANSGRLKELLRPGKRLWVAPGGSKGRKTPYNLLLVHHGQGLVSVDATLPNHLVEEALREGLLAPFSSYPHWQREVIFGESRLDFLLSNAHERCYMEVKSVTLVKRGTALFPDAPTERGRRHLLSLIKAREEGHQASVLFVVQREDAHRFFPNDETDSEFGFALREADKRGVMTLCYECSVSVEEIKIKGPLPVHL